MRWLYVSFVLLAVSSSVFAEAGSNSATKVDAMPVEEVQAARPANKWYVGATFGPASLLGWDWKYIDDYYYSIGYNHDPGWFNYDSMRDWNIYAGYRLRDFLDVEVGYSNNNERRRRAYYDFTNDVVSSRHILAQALYVTALYRPIGSGRSHGLYFKLGGHVSELAISKSVTGTPANLSTIAAGDNYPVDGTFRGFGTLFGLGFDFRTGNVGAVRLEMNRYYRLGGTAFGKAALNVGYSLNF